MGEARDSQAGRDPFLARLTVAAVTLLIVVNIFFIAVAPQLEELTGLREYAFDQLDLGTEFNFATWCSSMLLLLNSVLASVLAPSLAR